MAMEHNGTGRKEMSPVGVNYAKQDVTSRM